jgi:hypothetical protein
LRERVLEVRAAAASVPEVHDPLTDLASVLRDLLQTQPVPASRVQLTSRAESALDRLGKACGWPDY